MMRCEGRKTLLRKVERRPSSSGDEVGWKVGSAPEERMESARRGSERGRYKGQLTMFAARWGGAEAS